jgi:hypothetical protein
LSAGRGRERKGLLSPSLAALPPPPTREDHLIHTLSPRGAPWPGETAIPLPLIHPLTLHPISGTGHRGCRDQPRPPCKFCTSGLWSLLETERLFVKMKSYSETQTILAGKPVMLSPIKRCGGQSSSLLPGGCTGCALHTTGSSFHRQTI